MEGHLIKTDDGHLLWYDPINEVYTQVEQATAESVSSTEGLSLPPNLLELSSKSEIKKSQNNWNNAQTLLLIQTCISQKEKLNSLAFKKGRIFEEIAITINEFGYNFSPEQCANRMKTLIKKFRFIKDFNSQSGNPPKKWELYDIMLEYMGDGPDVIPVRACSSLMKSMESETSCGSHIKGPQQISTTINEEVAQCSREPLKKRLCPSADKKEIRKSRISPRVEMLKWLRAYKEETTARENTRLKLAQSQHEENKDMLNKILNALNK